jgi:hypothetical protein
MINFQLRSYIQALEYLDISKLRARARDADEEMPPEIKALILNQIGPIQHLIGQLGMEAAVRHISRLNAALRTRTTYGIVLREIEELWSALDHDTFKQLFCHYPADKVDLLLRLDANWMQVFGAFESARKEIEEGVDCYALGHNTACVFHMCRAAEIGLRAIAKERGISAVRGSVPLEWGTWGQVFQAIEPKIEEIKTKPNGPQKDAALAFYQQVLADLRAIHSYRDPVMHFHSTYDAAEARKVMSRAHDLLDKLATKLTDQTDGEIPWSAWP